MEMDGKEYFVTKPELARKMIEKIPDNEWKKAENILTVNSKVGEWVIEIYKKYGKNVANRVKIVPAGEKTKLFIKKTLNILGLDEYNILDIEDKNGNGTYDVRDFLDLDNEKIIELAGMPKGKKFDICLANPPYDNGLHESFLLKFLDIAVEIVSIQPANFVFGNRKNQKFIDIVKNNYCNIEKIINTFKGFDAAIGNDLGIFYIKINGNKKFIINNKDEDIDNLSKFIGDEYIEVFNNIVKSLYENDNIVKHLKVYNGNISDNYYIKIPRIRGHKYNGEADDFYTLISNNENFVLNDTLGKLNDIKNGKRSDLRDYLEFLNKDEALHFIKYCKTDFFRTCLYLLKNSQNIISGRILRNIPWFDFSDPHFSKSPREIDDWLFKKYNISDEIRKHIEGILPDYYNIRK